jgi:hypothetical protein
MICPVLKSSAGVLRSMRLSNIQTPHKRHLIGWAILAPQEASAADGSVPIIDRWRHSRVMPPEGSSSKMTGNRLAEATTLAKPEVAMLAGLVGHCFHLAISKVWQVRSDVLNSEPGMYLDETIP